MAESDGKPARPDARGPPRPLHGRRDLRGAARAVGHLRRPAPPGLTNRRCTHRVRILLVSQMYPGPDDPDLGSSCADSGARARGPRARARARRRRPARGRRAGTSRSRATRLRAARALSPRRRLRPLPRSRGPVRRARRRARRSSSPRTARMSRTPAARPRRPGGDALRGRPRGRRSSRSRTGCAQRLEAGGAAGRGEDRGDRLRRRSRPVPPRDAVDARPRSGGTAGTAFLCVGSLTERKNVLRLARAFERRGEGALAFVGDGPLRPALEGRPGIRLVGPRPVRRGVPTWIAAADVVCQPSLVEPFGLATLEAMAARPLGRRDAASAGRRSSCRPGAGVLVDPARRGRARRRARRGRRASPPEPRGPRGRRAEHDVRRRRSGCEEICSPRAARDRRA